jgi:hypothetical protein
MTTASLSSQFLRETKLLGFLYPAAVVLGVCSAFVSTHTNLKIVTSEPRSVQAPPTPMPDPARIDAMPAPIPAADPLPISSPMPPERTIWEFGFPEPAQPVSDVVAELLRPGPLRMTLAPSLTYRTRFSSSTSQVWYDFDRVLFSKQPRIAKTKIAKNWTYQTLWPLPDKTSYLAYLDQSDWMRNANWMVALKDEKSVVWMTKSDKLDWAYSIYSADPNATAYDMCLSTPLVSLLPTQSGFDFDMVCDKTLRSVDSKLSDKAVKVIFPVSTFSKTFPEQTR